MRARCDECQPGGVSQSRRARGGTSHTSAGAGPGRKLALRPQSSEAAAADRACTPLPRDRARAGGSSSSIEKDHWHAARLDPWWLISGIPMRVGHRMLCSRPRLGARRRLAGGWRTCDASTALLPVPCIPCLSPTGRAHYAQPGPLVSHVRPWTRPHPTLGRGGRRPCSVGRTAWTPLAGWLGE